MFHIFQYFLQNRGYLTETRLRVMQYWRSVPITSNSITARFSTLYLDTSRITQCMGITFRISFVCNLANEAHVLFNPRK